MVEITVKVVKPNDIDEEIAQPAFWKDESGLRGDRDSKNDVLAGSPFLLSPSNLPKSIERRPHNPRGMPPGGDFCSGQTEAIINAVKPDEVEQRHGDADVEVSRVDTGTCRERPERAERVQNVVEIFLKNTGTHEVYSPIPNSIKLTI